MHKLLFLVYLFVWLFENNCATIVLTKNLWFYLVDLLLWCEAAQTLTDQQTYLGQNVTINCDLVETEVYWFLLNLLYSVLILRSFTTPFYYNERFRQKYSVNSSHLLINNVTADELGVYYCMSTNTEPKFSKGTRLYITGKLTIDTSLSVRWCM